MQISEMFYSLQGEGRNTGTPAYFIRLAGCNLMCGGHGTEKDGRLYNGATWRCDSIESWTRGRDYTLAVIISMLGGEDFLQNLKRGAHVVITGGEPLLQQGSVMKFIDQLHDMTNNRRIGDQIEIETNGTTLPYEHLLWGVKYWNVSPKLKNSGMPKEKRVNTIALRELNKHEYSTFKFVVKNAADWAEIENDFLPYIDRSKIVLMPASDHREGLVKASEAVAEICKKECVKMSTRLHLTIWNKTTGV